VGEGGGGYQAIYQQAADSKYQYKPIGLFNNNGESGIVVAVIVAPGDQQIQHAKKGQN
jgi:hypothetical protein